MLSLPKPRDSGDEKADSLRVGDDYEAHSHAVDSELSIDSVDPEVGGETLERFLAAAAARGGPPGCGFVSLHTSLGDMCVELYWHHAPRTCLNFYLLAKRGYYDNTLFHRVCKGHWTQAGDPTGTGRGGASIYGKPFRDEIHPGLRHTGAGVLSMANCGPDTNTSQFLILLGPAPILDGKNSIFGRICKGIQTLKKLSMVQTTKTDRPLDDVRIIRASVAVEQE